MKAFVIAAVLLAPVPANACHRFSVWKYPTPQHCRVSSAPPHVRVADDDHEWYVEIVKPPPEKLDIPLPTLEHMDFPPDCIADWCQRLKGIGLLRERFGTN